MPDNRYDYDRYEEHRRRQMRERRAKQRRKRRIKKRIKWLLTRIIPFCLVVLLIFGLIIFGIVKLIGLITGKGGNGKENDKAIEESVSGNEFDQKGQPMNSQALEAAAGQFIETGDVSENDMVIRTSDPASDALLQSQGKISQAHTATTDENTSSSFPEKVVSSQICLVDMKNNRIVANRDCYQRVNPASMTKVLTLLVAAEHVQNLDDTFTITIDITDYVYKNDCSAVGFTENEIVTIRDLMYGTILPSGGDAAVGLATYVAGSQEAFVELMNAKLEELGLSESAHFTNCVGLYDPNHYCSAYDMAMIMYAAMDNELCREILSAHTYTTSVTREHPNGIEISNWFLRRIEDKDSGGEVVCAKTGYVAQSGNCAVSYATNSNQDGYILVTCNSSSSWRCIYDHVDIYKQYISKEFL